MAKSFPAEALRKEEYQSSSGPTESQSVGAFLAVPRTSRDARLTSTHGIELLRWIGRGRVESPILCHTPDI